jgi:Zn-finger nucleic acid-binding protein
MDIATGLAATTNALGIASWLRTVGKEFDAAEYKLKIADLVGALTDAKLALSEAKDKIADQDKEIGSLKANFQKQSELVAGEGDYRYLIGDNGKPLGFPICPACEVEGQIIQLKQNGGCQDAKCPRCKTEFTPVSCYLPEGNMDKTLHAQEGRIRDARIAEQNARIEAFNERDSSWI